MKLIDWSWAPELITAILGAIAGWVAKRWKG